MPGWTPRMLGYLFRLLSRVLSTIRLLSRVLCEDSRQGTCSGARQIVPRGPRGVTRGLLYRYCIATCTTREQAPTMQSNIDNLNMLADVTRETPPATVPPVTKSQKITVNNRHKRRNIRCVGRWNNKHCQLSWLVAVGCEELKTILSNVHRRMKSNEQQSKPRCQAPPCSMKRRHGNTMSLHDKKTRLAHPDCVPAMLTDQQKNKILKQNNSSKDRKWFQQHLELSVHGYCKHPAWAGVYLAEVRILKLTSKDEVLCNINWIDGYGDEQLERVQNMSDVSTWIITYEHIENQSVKSK